MVLPKPFASKAVISAFRTPVPVAFKIPIPLVALPTPKFVRVSTLLPKAADVSANVPAELVPINPPTCLPLFFQYPPSFVPSSLSKSEFASTIKASIRTCFVLISISFITLSTTSRSFSFPLTIIDLVVVSSVI